MTEIDPMSEAIGSLSTAVKNVQIDVTEIKEDVKHLLLFKAKVTAYGTIGGMFGGAAAWMIMAHFDKAAVSVMSWLSI